MHNLTNSNAALFSLTPLCSPSSLSPSSLLSHPPFSPHMNNHHAACQLQPCSNHHSQRPPPPDRLTTATKNYHEHPSLSLPVFLLKPATLSFVFSIATTGAVGRSNSYRHSKIMEGNCYCFKPYISSTISKLLLFKSTVSNPNHFVDATVSSRRRLR